MHFLRFGSSIPGPDGSAGWGCCAFDIIQGFSYGHPDEPASIELVCGDGGQPIGGSFLGKTYREIFEARLRLGTFSDTDLPNHGFLCVITESQITSTNGKAWLRVFKENGFEFIRAVDNSVYSGDDLPDEYYNEDDHESSINYLFGLFRNIGVGKIGNPFAPPLEWMHLEGGVPEVFDKLDGDTMAYFNDRREELHLKRWNEIGYPTFYLKEELHQQGIPVTMAGRRSAFPQESEDTRNAKLAQSGESKPAPFALKV